MEDSIIKYIKSLTEEERLKYCRKQITHTIRDFKSKERAVSAEFNFKGCRTGVRGGRQTTLSAKAYNSTKAYFDSIEALKIIIKHL